MSENTVPQNNPKALSRVLKPFSVLLITLSLITPACSFFILTPGVIAISGTGALLSFILASIVAVLLAVVWAELSSAFPISGGDYTLVGKTLGRFWGFIMLILVLVISVFSNALTAVSMASYLSVVFGDMNPVVIGLVFTITATVISIVRIQVNAVVTGIFLAVELLLLVLITIVGFMKASHPVSSLFLHTVHLDPETKTLASVPIGMVVGAMSVALFTLNGYGAAVYFGEELVGARTTMGKIILLAVLLSVLTQIFPLVAVLLSSNDLHAFFSADHMIEYFLETHVSHTTTLVASFAVATALFNALIATILAGARLVYSSGRDGIWAAPINRALSEVHPKFASPAIATLLLGSLSAFACFCSLNFLILATSTVLVATYFFICFAVIAGRYHGKTNIGHYRMPLYPLPPILAIIALIYVLVSTWQDKFFGRPSLIVTGIILLSAMAYYVLFLYWRKDWEIKGPDEYVDNGH